MGIFDKFKSGLGKSSSSLTVGFKNIFSKKKIDSTILEEFEELIISSDAGVDVAKELRKDFESLKVDKKLDDHKEILKLLADKLAINLQKYEKDLSLMGNAKSAVIVVSGVNGVGKTTSIGKLGKYFKDNNRSVVFGAADTFRAAAIDQLQVWAAKVKVDIIKSEINSDPASVAFKTAEFAKKNEIDVALIDTAGINDAFKEKVENESKAQTLIALEDSDIVIFVIDGRVGVLPVEKMYAKSLIKTDKPTIILVNKSEGTRGGLGLSESVSLGFEDVIPFSAEHGEGLSDLYDCLKPVSYTHLRAHETLR